MILLDNIGDAIHATVHRKAEEREFVRYDTDDIESAGANRTACSQEGNTPSARLRALRDRLWGGSLHQGMIRLFWTLTTVPENRHAG
jgi:hypothetical protein